MKVLHAPVNIAGQPMTLVRELRRQGVEATLLQYASGAGHRFQYETDWVLDLKGGDRFRRQLETLSEVVARGFDVVHLWMGPLLATGVGWRGPYGLDLPFLKARGIRVVYTATGFDVRVPSAHRARTPHHAFAHGYRLDLDERRQAAFGAFLRGYVDRFCALDPEMAEWLPSDAAPVPRAIDLDAWSFVGVRDVSEPLVVHGPSNPAVKGTAILEAALDRLRRRGACFRYQRVEGLPHDQARAWYERADVVVDQLHIGWYGVLAVEAMALGKPVIAYVRDDLRSHLGGEPPLAMASPADVETVLDGLLADASRRRALGVRARAWAEAHHDVRRIAAGLREVYADVVDRPPRRPVDAADLAWFGQAYASAEAAGLRRAISAHPRLGPAARRSAHAVTSMRRWWRRG